MPTIVCQNVMSSHFESQLIETTATLKLKVVAAPPPETVDISKKLTNDEFGNWGFLQTTPKEKNGFYTEKPSFSKLTPISLELCTENLGSETGSDTSTDSGILSFSSCAYSSEQNLATRERADDQLKRKTRTASDSHHETDKYSCRKISNFPPPLTSMSGSSNLQVRRHREGGRLIIEAVEAPFRNSYLQAERSDGRLKLCFLTSSGAAETPTSATVDDENEEECSGGMAADEEIEAAVSESESENESNEIDSEMNGIEKYQWVGRCKEDGHGNKGLCNNWKPALWVATS
ncbi:hypothetical protein BUALT_Bualt14G0086000 [Buddleja alternifolia]|uniref:FAF domain-containing protein n=1 Tax=Buddleja alternifolia TaxID=168488 RepID=A0AAV6WG66_9LAMI|nr:hypothetical protein BUALT_Bualt14G0086000 [Buddleja alternifolia]